MAETGNDNFSQFYAFNDQQQQFNKQLMQDENDREVKRGYYYCLNSLLGIILFVIIIFVLLPIIFYMEFVFFIFGSFVEIFKNIIKDSKKL
ncbi:hypothetical protein A0H76_1265 [Hepatospora eriocheir]|uniref:Transmembrane protein n=1 Tax=Hepatospora eriocheir TaxID=1081669 RepID=A0A1X0QKS3_9MICR|nr:hypothetical protein A0H76_1265 [Hepatospora eriocheir]